MVNAGESEGFVALDDLLVRDEMGFITGATVGEVIMLKEELKFLQGELIEVLVNYEALKERNESLNLQIIKAMIANVNEDSEEILSVSRSALNVVSEVTRKQSAKAIVFCDLLSRKLKDVFVSDLNLFELNQALESFKVSSQRVVAFLDGKQSDQKAISSNVLSIDNKLQIVILAVGARNGVDVGDVWFVGGVALKAVSVRPYVTAMMLLRGKISDMAPGLKAYKDAVTRTKK